MHAETLAYMLHRLPIDRKSASTDLPEIATPPVAHLMVEIPAGVATLGLPRDNRIFGWDNEFESHKVNVPAFSIDRYKVTNRQFLDFVAAGGYETRALWSDADWTWKSAQGVSHPAFWKHAGNEWLYRTMFDEVPLPPDWPVYRQPGGSSGVRALGWEIVAHRSGVAASCIRNAKGRRASLPMGQRPSQSAIRQF